MNALQEVKATSASRKKKCTGKCAACKAKRLAAQLAASDKPGSAKQNAMRRFEVSLAQTLGTWSGKFRDTPDFHVISSNHYEPA